MDLIRSAGVSAALAAAIVVTATVGVPAALAGTASGSVTPSIAAPGTSVTFAVQCASLHPTAATLSAASLGLGGQVTMQRSTSQSGTFQVTVQLPSTIRVGTYQPSVSCSDGSSTTVALKVNGLPSGEGVPTGDGTTATATRGGLLAVGLGVFGFGAVTGGLALRRRATRRAARP